MLLLVAAFTEYGVPLAVASMLQSRELFGAA
jgi:hypothetical protein